MEGYVIKSENGHFLSKKYYWFPHDTPEEAWVHPKTVLGYLQQNARSWQTKPAEVYPATWSEGGGTVVEQPFPFRFEDPE
jgi:hypothetical protein